MAWLGRTHQSLTPPLPLPRVSVHPPISPTTSQLDTAFAVAETTLSLPALSAVVIVGPIDGDAGPWELSEISSAESTVWLDKDYWNGRWQCSSAFGDLAEVALQDLFIPPTLDELPAEVSFYYSILEQRFPAAGADLRIINIEDGSPLDWTIEKEGEWFEATPAEGQSPDILSIAPDSFDPFNPGALTGSITITVVDPQ